MAIYHFSARMVQRSKGQSVVAVAARRSGTVLRDERLGCACRPLRDGRPVHSEILLPAGASPGWSSRAALWNGVEAFEPRRNSALAREVEIALPFELSQSKSIDLARTFASFTFVGRGMAVDLNVWAARGADEAPRPWASLLLTTREIHNGTFGKKVRLWNSRGELVAWRREWAEAANRVLAQRGLPAELDHRSNAARGIAVEPQNKIGPAAMRRARAGEDMERVEEHDAIARRNAARCTAL